jgi:hypothetical protein
MAGKPPDLWAFVSFLLIIMILLFLANHPLNCPVDAPTGVLDSVLYLLCR